MTSRTWKILLNGFISGGITFCTAITDAIANHTAFADGGWFTNQTWAIALVGGALTALMSWKSYVAPPPV